MTAYALLSIKNDIHLSLSQGEATALVLLDLSAAFDTIDCSTLLSCLLDWFSVSGSALKWFSSYLTERFNLLRLVLLCLIRCASGFCSGSSPILSLHISPSTLIGKHKGVNFHFYTNDSQLYVHLSHMNDSSAFDKLNRCLQDVRNGCQLANLNLILVKVSLYFLAQRNREKGNPLHPTESVRNVGEWFDSDFSFSKHIQNVCKSCFIQLRDFRNIMQFLTQDAAVLAANAFVSSRC